MEERGTTDEIELVRIARSEGLVAQARIDECLAIREEMAHLGFPIFLGKILIQKNYLDRLTVAALLRAAAGGAETTDAQIDTRIDLVRLTEPEHRILLARIRDRGLASVEDLDACYDIQCHLEKRGIDKGLGEILVERGLVSRDLVLDILSGEKPTDETAGAPEAVPAGEVEETYGGRVSSSRFESRQKQRFGQIAIRKGLLQLEDVQDALYAQLLLGEAGLHRKIGEILVEKGRLDQA